MIDSSRAITKTFIILLTVFVVYYLNNTRILTIKSNIDFIKNSVSDDFIKVYNSTVLKNYIDVIDIVNNSTLENIKNNQDFLKFANQNLNLFSNLSFIKVNIYNRLGQKIITNNQSEIINLLNFTSKLGFFDSLFIKLNNLFFNDKEILISTSQQVDYICSNLITNAAYKSNNNTITGALVKIIAPLKVKDLPIVDLYIELYIDVKNNWNQINVKYLKLTILYCLPLIFLYTILNLIWLKSDRLIEKLHEQNVELIEGKTKAEKESNEKSQFLANVSHELRTPLNAIIGFSEIIKTEAMGPIGSEQYRDYINDINSSGIHLLSLINDILDYSKAEAEKLEVDSIEVDLTKTMVTSMRFVQPRAENAKVKLIENFPKNHIVIIADPKRLKQVLLNMLSNAVKFTPEGGSVTLSAWIDEINKEILIQIKDTGIGIAERDIPKAMSTFGQVDSKLSRRYEGTGLGLPLTKKLVELMGGVFNLQSELGFGTTITLKFPDKAVKNIN